MITERLDGLDAGRHDLCIVGAGPVGLTLALEWARYGRRVLVLESGGRRPVGGGTIATGPGAD
ncbi:NAD(P)-binding protein, partial [Prosthecodimorpha staleyi]